MTPLDLARWQFGITTVYHFMFVPLSIGLSLLLALMQTAWFITGNTKYLAMTKFWSKLFLINFAMGVVTGIVQEFQFGMNWNDYSRFVGDVFGGPLAVEALLAFFLEATFIGLWIFGWDRLPKAAHLACIWVVAIATNLSAFFILAANSWMQNPVGYQINPERGRAELTDFWGVLTNKVNLVAYPHVATATLLSAGALVVGVSAWHLARKKHEVVMRSSLKLGLWVALIGGALVAQTGDMQAKVMTEVQPMKMAAAEAIYETQAPASFSVFTIGSLDGSDEIFSLRLPYLLSFLATGDFTAPVEGINDVQAHYEQQFGPGDYKPLIPVTYWSFRFMIGFGMTSCALAFVGLVGLWWSNRGRRWPRQLYYKIVLWTIPFPLIGNAFGWIFTEMGRQPWVVFGHMFTRDGVSANVSIWEVGISVVGFTLLYLVLAITEVRLLMRYAKVGPPDVDHGPDDDEDASGDGTRSGTAPRPMSFAY